MTRIRAEQKEDKSKLPISPKYVSKFREIKAGEQLMLREKKSDAQARVQIRAKENDVYYARPDGEIIPEVQGVRRADYVIYCCGSKQQVSFVEMKGQNIQVSEDKSPCTQILATLEYFSNDEGLKKLVSSRVEKHAFIVSALRQRVPSGISITERKLLRRLGAGSYKDNAREYLHYVKYEQKGRYSDKDSRIICSYENPLEFPYEKQV